jgi:threonine synthase
MQLISTRGKNETAEALDAVLRGIAPDGGLYVPASFPALGDIEGLLPLRYDALAARVLSLFFEGAGDMEALTRAAYESFDDPAVAPVKRIAEGQYVMELWHGPTLAFKDMALCVLPRLMTAAMRQERGRDVLILVATSGDTGKAALEGFRDVPHTRIFVFYPDEGVSDMQKLQMTTQRGGNTFVTAVRGNFDDAQTGVKAIFADKAFAAKAAEKGFILSSANSINFGRLAPQIAYYVWAYAQLRGRGDIAEGEKINFVVPTGNFGNILAAYYAKRMRLPVNKLICASNKNNVLTDFFRQGEYSLERPFHKTMSPSMDILISSNLERLLYELTGRDETAVRAMMAQLKATGRYGIGEAARSALKADFWADWCGEDETRAAIRRTFEQAGYLADTHTAVALGVYEKYRASGDDTKTVVVSTASPYKFPGDVLASLGGDGTGSPFEVSKRLSELTHSAIPRQLSELETSPVRHTAVVDIPGMADAVLRAL